MKDVVGVPVFYSCRSGQRAMSSGIPNRATTNVGDGGGTDTDGGGGGGERTVTDPIHQHHRRRDDRVSSTRATNDNDTLPERFIHTNGNRRNGIIVWKVNKVSFVEFFVLFCCHAHAWHGFVFVFLGERLFCRTTSSALLLLSFE